MLEALLRKLDHIWYIQDIWINFALKLVFGSWSPLDECAWWFVSGEAEVRQTWQCRHINLTVNGTRIARHVPCALLTKIPLSPQICQIFTPNTPKCYCCNLLLFFGWRYQARMKSVLKKLFITTARSRNDTRHWLLVKVLKDSPFCVTELVLRKWTRNICSLCSSQNVQHKLSNYALKISWNWPMHYIACEVLDIWLCWYFIQYHGTKKSFFIFVLVTWWKYTRKAICLDSLVLVLLFSTSRFLNSNSSTWSSCTSSHQNFKLKLNVYQCECHPTC